jgi:23S rRNA (cytosine1962-C5)-methyltransferase
MQYPIVKLKQDDTAPVPPQHPWIFSGAIDKTGLQIQSGEIVSVADAEGNIIATGTYSTKSMIAVRVFEFGEATIDREFLKRRIEQADLRRQLLGYGPGTDTTAYRVVYGESDGLPGLAVDRFEDIFVIQLSTAGMDRFRDDVVSILKELFSPAGIYERSDIPTRAHEGLDQVSQLLDGTVPELVTFLEGGRKMQANLVAGQKTGYFLDQKELRHWISRMSSGRKALDLFSFSGGNGIAALAGGASEVTFVDSSEPALSMVEDNVRLNGFDAERTKREASDVFQWLSSRRTPEYDMIICDPPALIKSRRHAESGRKGYHFLNRAAIRLINHNGLLVTSSCSGFFTEEDFEITLRRAAEQANVELRVVRRLYQSPDHPMAPNFPESKYLKSFICQVYRD